MRYRVYALTFALSVWVSVTGQAQRYNPGYSTPEPAAPVPTIAEKRLYLRDRENIYCLDIAGK